LEWSAYFDLAQELVNLAEELDEHEAEAYRRSAVSRAYYAMFCTARDMLDGVGDYNPPPHGSEHAYVWNN
jgi:uncharacterized protein (UPF0332 family)